MMNTEKIIAKIKKVLELSRNNPSEEEAKAAALKAQRLMAEYHLSEKDIDSVEDADLIIEKVVHTGTGSKWKYSLAGIIAKNFRCKYFFYGKIAVAFYGYEVDVEIAAETFKFLFATGNKAATNYYNKLRNESKRNGCHFDGMGIKNCFLVGYMQGISETLDRQCTALMIVVPQKVEEAYSERSKSFTTVNNTLNTLSYHGSEAVEEGRNAGRNAIGSRYIATA